jgi:hypothetical protein
MLNWGNVTGDGKNSLMDARRASMVINPQNTQNVFGAGR